MPSIYQHALGTSFGRLQPQLQDYFSLSVGSRAYGAGTGSFDVVGCPLPWLRPLIAPAAGENAFFPEYGRNIEFRIENYAHLDPYGRPSLTARRSILFPGRPRTFEDTTSLDPQAGVVDYIGRHRRMVTDLSMQVTAAGHLRMVSANARISTGAALLALPKFLDAKAYMEQWWDAAAGRFRISTKVITPALGTIFVYAGSFDYRLHAAEAALPGIARPERWERHA